MSGRDGRVQLPLGCGHVYHLHPQVHHAVKRNGLDAVEVARFAPTASELEDVFVALVEVGRS